jgi:hypothetical protein
MDHSMYSDMECERVDESEPHAGHLWSYGQWDEDGEWWDENNYWCPGYRVPATGNK